MRSYQIKRKNNIIIGVLCAVVLLMVVGYAAFSSVLNIKGTSGISSNWDIEITNIRGGNPEGGDAYDISEPTYTPTTATFSTGLKTPNTNRMYEVEVTNKGTLGGLVTIASLSCGNNEAIGCEVAADKEKIVDENWEWLDYDQSNEQFFEQGQQDYSDIAFTLAPGEKHYIYVDVWYRDVENQPDNLSASIKLELTYEQAGLDENGIAFPSFNGTIDDLKDNLVTIGSGLYADEYEEGRYVYKGLKPNNYIKFNDELWRILAIESDGVLKIIKNDSINVMSFDSRNNRYNANSYCSNIYQGLCNAWAIADNFVNGTISGPVLKDSSIKTYIDENYKIKLTDVAKSYIVNYNFNVGPIVLRNTNLTEQIQSEKSNKWNGDIGLMSSSDYIRANSDKNACGTISLLDKNVSDCATTNWINVLTSMVYSDSSYTSRTAWTMTPIVNSIDYIFHTYSNDEYSCLTDGFWVNFTAGVFPVTHLKSDIILKGSGTQTDPYVIVE